MCYIDDNDDITAKNIDTRFCLSFFHALRFKNIQMDKKLRKHFPFSHYGSDDA